eukprot:GHRR01002248.1.p3 GENE.GHRR01002248.1~~GHRR01002248.1.p3  ORF type:complete len:116 (+),score=60.29 GHRR01002248.1:1497-1844(+)
MRGEYGKEVGNAAEQLTLHMDKFVSGCFRGFEDSYNKLEKAIRHSMDWRNKPALAGAAGQKQRRRRTTLQLMARNSSSDEDSDSEPERGSPDEDMMPAAAEQQQLLGPAAAVKAY